MHWERPAGSETPGSWASSSLCSLSIARCPRSARQLYSLRYGMASVDSQTCIGSSLAWLCFLEALGYFLEL